MARSDARAETAVLSCAIRVVVCCRVKRKHYRFQTDSLVFRNYKTFSRLMNSESCLFLTVTICQSWWLGSSINSMGPVPVKPTLTKFGTIGGAQPPTPASGSDRKMSSVGREPTVEPSM